MTRYLLSAQRLLPLIAALFTLFVASSSAWAQTTGEIRGTVSDSEMGLPIPNVSVIVSSPNLIGGAQTRSTNAEGVFHFVELPSGTYELTANKEKFKAVTIRGIAVNISRTTIQNVEMDAGHATESIDIVAKAKAVDVEDVSRGEVLTKDFLEKIPAGRSYQSAVQMVAGVTGGANPNMAGAAYNENTYMLDGANITDPVTGTFSLNFNFDAIQQIEVLLGGYEPEYGTSLGGVINVVTESGNNNLQFQSSIFYDNGNWSPKRDSRYTGEGFDLALTQFDTAFENLQVNGKVSGPVVRDRAWFIVSYSHARSRLANTGIPQKRDYDGHYVLGKLTVQPNSEHRITAFIQLDPTTVDNTDQSNPYQKPEAQGRQAQGGYVASGRWQWFLSPDANIDTTVVVQKSYIESNAVPCTHDPDSDSHPCKPGEREGEVDWETPGRLGLYGAYNSVNYPQYYFDDRFRYQAATKLSVLSIKDPLGGSHDFKFGVEAAQTIWDQIQGFAGNTMVADLNVVGFDPQTFQSYYWFEITGPIKFRTSGSEFSWFAQDAWKPVSNLTVKYGTRFDKAVMRNDIGAAVINSNMFGPRLFAAWDPMNDQKTKIAGGYGRFNDTGRLAVPSFTSLSGYGSKIFYGEYVNSFDQTLGFHNAQEMMVDLGPKTNRNIAHDNLRTPRADEILLMAEREIIQDVALGTSTTGKFTRFMYEFDETNVIYDEDGSSVIGSRLADPLNNYYRLRTPTLAKRDYYQTDFFLRKVSSRRWAAQATYTYTQSIGSSTSALSGSFANDPQSQFNYGPMTTDIRHSVKAWAWWDVPTDPWKQTLGLTFVYESGSPLERLYYSDEYGGYSQRIQPRGIYYRFNPWWELNFLLQQTIDVRKGEVLLSAQVSNLTNNQAPWGLSSAFYTENRLFAVSRQSPMRFQIGAEYKY